MKFKSLILTAIAAGMMITSCSGPGEGRSLEEIKNPTTSDSIANLLGQMYASDYWKNCMGDSTLMSREARDSYLQGIREALKNQGKDNSYIEGYILGLHFIQYTSQFKDEYGTDVNLNDILQGIAYGLRNDSIVDFGAVSGELNKITTRLHLEKDKKDHRMAVENLRKYATSNGMTKYSDDLYGKILKEGQGANLTKGDMVECQIMLSDESGKRITVPLPNEVTIEKPDDNVFQLALTKLKDGGAGDFASNGYAVFGVHSSKFNVAPDQTLVIHISVKKIAGKKAQPADETPKSSGADGNVEIKPAK